MATNLKSTQLLSGVNIMRSTSQSRFSQTPKSTYMGRDIMNEPAPHVYDEVLGDYTNYDEMHKTQLTASESIGINSTFQHVRFCI